jgi:uncharacterized membrane protein YbhN (UPF0104 family)
MKSWKKWLAAVTGLLFTGYFLYFVFETFSAHELDALLRRELILGILLAALLNVLLVPIAGLAWSILLKSMYSDWKPLKLSAIIGFTQLAKYVPGNVAQHIGRTTVALMAGMPLSIFASSVLAEVILLLSASVFIGLLCISLSPTTLPLIDFPLSDMLVVLAFILVASALTLPYLIRHIPDLVRRYSRLKMQDTPIIPTPSTSAATKAFILYCLSYLVLGVSIWIIASQHGGLIHLDIFTLTASFTLAWLAGYLAPGAPAGLGVREGALALLLANTGPAEYVLTIIVAARIATMLADALCFAFSAHFIRKIENRN